METFGKVLFWIGLLAVLLLVLVYFAGFSSDVSALANAGNSTLGALSPKYSYPQTGKTPAGTTQLV